MSSISFQDVKSTLQNNFISLGCSPAAVNQLLTDDFINGIITICEQNQNQYNGEILACVENLNNSPNLSTGKIFHDTFYIEAKKDGIVKDIIEYLNKNINISLSETPTPALLSLQNLNENTSTLNTGDDITIGKGANINAQDVYGHTPLFIAFGLKNKNAVDTLIKLGADSNIQANDGSTYKDVGGQIKRAFYQ